MKWFWLGIASLFQVFLARGDIVLFDSFDYPDGPIVDAVGTPWNSHSGGGTGGMRRSSPLENFK
ncbi:MAG: hypothetical protein ABIR24_14800 [Verrucomicrobiota bacterium]